MELWGRGLEEKVDIKAFIILSHFVREEQKSEHYSNGNLYKPELIITPL